jgi:tRNA(fMet)-specific endonuclease VapC
MSGRFLLDTNVVIAIFAQDGNVLAQLQQASEVFVASVVLGELYYGANKSSRVIENIRRIGEFSAANRVLACDAETAQAYGEIKNNLRKKGRPIPENDIWIAALAQQHDLILVTSDGHFGEIDGLKIEHW